MQMKFQHFILLYEALNPVVRRNRKQMLRHFKNLNNYSSWNAEHSVEVAKLARDFSKYIGLQLKKIDAAAMTHDIGKVKIPKSILHKPDTLTPDEREIINTHAMHSADLLKTLTGEHGKLSRLMASMHHTKPEELDNLYQKGELTSDEVKMIKIITICDTFEALISTARPYKEGKPKQIALDMMETSDKIDSKLFEKFKHWQYTEFANDYR